jgi:nitroreductase
MKDEPLSFEGVDPASLISYDTFLKFIRGKRSIRQYKKKKIPKEIIDKIMYTMRYAPTGGNIRGLKCNIISDDEQIKALSEAVLDTLIGSPAIPENYTAMLKIKRKRGLDPIFYGASHVMIFHSPSPLDMVNSVIAITHGMLSAQTLGIGSCWLYLAQRALIANEDLRKNVAKINGRVHGVFVLGYPAVKYARGPPRPKIRTKILN